MNPALTPLSRIREMSNAELVAFAKEHSTLTILEREFLRRMERVVGFTCTLPYEAGKINDLLYGKES